MTRFRLCTLVLLLVLVLPPVLSACTAAPQRDRYGRGGYDTE